MKGQIYIIKNEMYNYYGDNIYKIGKAKDVDIRAGNYTTYYPKKCNVLYSSDIVNDYNLCEFLIFKILDKFRLSTNREFFKGDIEYFKSMINKIIYAINKDIINDLHRKFDIETLNNLLININKQNLNKQTNSKNKKTHICEKCNRVFTKKSTYIDHINRKTSCVQKKIECEHCHKEFTRRSYLKIHTEKCKHRDDNNEPVNVEIVEDNINTAHNNIELSFLKINSFLKEDLSKLTKKDKINILEKSSKCIHEFIEILNFNPNILENHNVYITSINSNYGHIYDGTKWTLCKIDKLLNGVINKIKDYIKILLEEYEEILSNEVIDNIMDIIDIIEYDPLSDEEPIDKNKKKLKKQIMDEVKLLLYNNKDIPQATRMKQEKIMNQQYKNS
jgi:hypothetical protein